MNNMYFILLDYIFYVRMWFTYNMLMLAHAFYLQSSDFLYYKTAQKNR